IRPMPAWLLLLVTGALSVAWFRGGWGYGMRYQGRVYTGTTAALKRSPRRARPAGAPPCQAPAESHREPRRSLAAVHLDPDVCVPVARGVAVSARATRQSYVDSSSPAFPGQAHSTRSGGGAIDIATLLVVLAGAGAARGSRRPRARDSA